jgi:hypothetical protein
MLLTYNQFNLKVLLEKKETQQTEISKEFMSNLLKHYNFNLITYMPLLRDMAIYIKMEGDKSNYDKMLDRLISLHYYNIKEIYTIKSGEEMKIFIK